ncbi:entericidin A/B family lipoprotein [Salinicola peritrichatus]|nr:entericidin A/B family lipoprotein [Salinicola peritrichatus]
MKRWVRVLLAGCLMLALSACNTMHGLGKDIERGGEKIQNAAN